MAKHHREEALDSLPSTRTLLTSLIASIRRTGPGAESATSNPLASANEETRSLILTLHTLFPNELLPALDLLDRGLVTRFELRSEPAPDDAHINDDAMREDLVTSEELLPHRSPPKGKATYYVRSAQQVAANARSRYRVDNPIYYEVHVNAWSCSCPAFAFSAFPAILSNDQPAMIDDETDNGTDYGWRFGGVMRGSDAPVCKHLLACTLIAHCEAFASMAEERGISADEMAGWAAGWGD